ncbi:hypothetical protein Tco_1081830 [Tanacetum coccineum]|uniref:Uncharacterized protein n=1 Tax=Tanacetum coccineum TaxID=301880 RepID=A0ABQ5I059_9ASTR
MRVVRMATVGDNSGLHKEAGIDFSLPFFSLQCLSLLVKYSLQNTMAEQNVPTQPPIKTDEQIVPRSYYLTCNIPGNTMKYNEKTEVYSCQVDEQWFDLSADLLKKALAITPINPTHPFELPPSELLWEEFTQRDLGHFFSHKEESQSHLKNPKKKSNSYPHSLWTVFQEYYIRKISSFSKGESLKCFEWQIPDPLITEAIQQSSYYPKYLEMVAENTKKTPQESASLLLRQRNLPKRKLPQKVRKGKSPLLTVDEDDEAQQESIPQEEGNDPDLERAKKMSLEAHQEKGEGEGDDADLERAIKLSLDPALSQPQGRAPLWRSNDHGSSTKQLPKLHEVVGQGKGCCDRRTNSSFTLIGSGQRRKEY